MEAFVVVACGHPCFQPLPRNACPITTHGVQFSQYFHSALTADLFSARSRSSNGRTLNGFPINTVIFCMEENNDTVMTLF